MDSQRVLSWMQDPLRKPANVAFTEGDERQAAYLIELAEDRLKKQVEEMRPVVEAAILYEVTQETWDNLEKAIETYKLKK